MVWPLVSFTSQAGFPFENKKDSRVKMEIQHQSSVEGLKSQCREHLSSPKSWMNFYIQNIFIQNGGKGIQGGGFKYFLFSPLLGEDSHFD